MREFSASVVESIKFYVYSLTDPRDGQIFYIGKGSGNRIFHHINTALADETANDKFDRIRAIHASGSEVKHTVHRHGLEPEQALEVEAALIDFVGLSGLTNLVSGHDSDDRGQMSADEVIAKFEAPLVKISERAILITINKMYQHNMSADDLYKMTRGNWIVGERREKADYAFAVYKGIIREVYKIKEWVPAPDKNNETKTWQRWQFEGKVADSMKHYVGGRAKNGAKAGAQNPIRYINC